MSLQQFACRCLNITISSTAPASAPVDCAAVHFERIHVGDDGIKMTHSRLTLRRRTATAEKVQWNTVLCLLCRTTVYRVASEVPADFELRDGLVAAPEDFAEGEILRGRDGYIELNLGSDGCMDAKAISAARTDPDRYSDTFGLLLPVQPKPAPLSGPSTPQCSSSPQPTTAPQNLLPTLPPLFHPPPYSPSHPVFVRLSKTASATSARYRAEAERAIQACVEAQAARVLEQERLLRGQVEVIWSRWRESWKQETDSSSPAEPSVLATHAGAVVIPVREFSPTTVSGSAIQGSQRRPSIPPTPLTGPSMLSQSLRQSHFVPPPQSALSTTPSPQLPASTNGVKNPLDDSFAVSASFQIRAGDALRAHESAKDQEERRRKRLSSRSNPPPPAVPEEPLPEDEDTHVTTPRNGVAEGKRKVTFQADVKEEDGGSQPVLRKADDGDGEGTGTPIMFDLDDDEEPNQAGSRTDEQQTPSEEPTTPRVRAQIKAKSKTPKDPPKIGHKAPVPALLTVNLGPSPAPAKPKPSPKSPSSATSSESPKTRSARPGEDKLLELVAAGYPSHRAAWKPNGKAWDLFDARRKFADSPDSASMTSEDSNGSKWNNPSQFATSLPVTIAAGPLASTAFEAGREPKTSLRNEPGEFVPVLRPEQTPRQTRERTYAMRDIARSMDPGPVLELQAAEDAADETDEDEDEDVGELSSAERVRRRTMRIVQRQSGVPDAGMWRSIAS